MRKTTLTSLAAAILMLPGCAQLVSGSSDDLTVSTNPPGADCTLYRDGKNIGRINPTPGTVRVARSYDDITVNCVKPEFEDGAATAGSGFNGWVLGNLFLGGIVGTVIDVATANATGYDDVTVSLLPAAAVPPVSDTESQPAPLASREAGSPTS